MPADAGMNSDGEPLVIRHRGNSATLLLLLCALLLALLYVLPARPEFYLPVAGAAIITIIACLR